MHAPTVAFRVSMLAAAVLLGAVSAIRAAEPAVGAGGGAGAGGAAILNELKSFGTVGTVLHVAAHPDDENRTMLAYLSRGRLYRTGYLSVTRGDGGQNEIGPEFGDKLGVARTQELLAGRKADGGTQFFTRALDFGYTKTLDEALATWDHQAVLGDVVRVIRTFRPDVIATNFAPDRQPGNHGHHNASAVLAVEAFKISGDPTAYPEQIAEGLKPWKPTRIVQGGGNDLSIQISGTEAVTGDTFQAISARASAAHKTQFGLGGGGGGRGGRGGGGGGVQTVGFKFLDGAPAAAGSNDLMSGVDTTWNRFGASGTEVARQVDAAIAAFKTDNPAASMPALLALRRLVAAIPADPVVNDKRAQLDRIVQACAGITVATTAAAYDVVPGDPLRLNYSATLAPSAAAATAVKLTEVRVAALASAKPGTDLKATAPIAGQLSFTIPKTTPITQPYWLREEPAPGMARVTAADTRLIGTAENPPAFVVEYVFDVGGQSLIVSDEPLAPDLPGKPLRRLAVISPVALRFGSIVALFTPGAKKNIEIEVTAETANADGTLRVETPAGWTLTPASQAFKLARKGDKTRLTFAVTAPAQTTTGSFRAVAEVGGTRFSAQRDEVRYDHIPPQILQPQARLRVATFDYTIRGKAIGYLPGAGDSVAECIEQLGYNVTLLKGADLTADNLKKFDAVVIGVRAFNERTDFKENLPGLFTYVEAGGTVIAQYNRPNGLNTEQLGPYPLSIAGPAPTLRVTDENAKVSILDTENPAINIPNKIVDTDWAGWVQERGTYFASSWDQNAYKPLLAMSDPGEGPLRSSVLIAKHGKGHYVYTGLTFFRQLPAGVPGAYRLFANFLALGK